ncbi:MAG: ankyrin repeat domain-containing protein [Pseudomonadota bacterium]
MRTYKLLALTAATLLPMLASAGDLAAMIHSGDRSAALAAIRDGANVNALQNDGSSPLLWAVYKVDYELVEALLKKGAKPDLANALGATPLNEAITVADEKMTFMLLKAGANPNLGNADDETPLMLAARVSSLPIAQALVKAGAKVNQREKYRNQSALMWAVDSRSAAITDLLIQHKAEVDFRAAENDWGNQITSEPRAQYRETGGLTPLLYAARSGCVECIKSLVKARRERRSPDTRWRHAADDRDRQQ